MDGSLGSRHPPGSIVILSRNLSPPRSGWQAETGAQKTLTSQPADRQSLTDPPNNRHSSAGRRRQAERDLIQTFLLTEADKSGCREAHRSATVSARPDIRRRVLG